jgi:hypothetical protein
VKNVNENSVTQVEALPLGKKPFQIRELVFVEYVADFKGDFLFGCHV